MRFNLVINLERYSPDQDMQDIVRHVTEMVQMADEGGFDIVPDGHFRSTHRASVARTRGTVLNPDDGGHARAFTAAPTDTWGDTDVTILRTAAAELRR